MEKPLNLRRRLVADDGTHKISISVSFLSRNGLDPDEVGDVVKQAIRGIAATLPTLPYTDFGVENTRV